MSGLAIKDVAERTGLNAGTIRIWEQRYGFPEPARTPSGYRIYTDDDVAVLRRIVALRRRGLSVPAALEQAREVAEPTDRASIYGALVATNLPLRPQRLRKRTLVAMSRAIEDEAMARAAGPVVVGAFQRERHYRAVEHRYRRLATVADSVAVFADFPEVHVGDREPAELPIPPDASLGHEWAVVIDAPGFAACLVAWETPESERDRGRPDAQREFESLWTMDPAAVRHAAHAGAMSAGQASPSVRDRLERLLAERPLAFDSPAPGLTALTNRMLGYLEA
jgi:MerR family transcriptional regulator, light-induced transcriptional regulator